MKRKGRPLWFHSRKFPSRVGFDSEQALSSKIWRRKKRSNQRPLFGWRVPEVSKIIFLGVSGQVGLGILTLKWSRCPFTACPFSICSSRPADAIISLLAEAKLSDPLLTPFLPLLTSRKFVREDFTFGNFFFHCRTTGDNKTTHSLGGMIKLRLLSALLPVSLIGVFR